MLQPSLGVDGLRWMYRQQSWMLPNSGNGDRRRDDSQRLTLNSWRPALRILRWAALFANRSAMPTVRLAAITCGPYCDISFQHSTTTISGSGPDCTTAQNSLTSQLQSIAGAERVPIPAAAELLVIDSGISHNHAAGEYRIRREECERAAELLGFPQLRDLDVQDLWRLVALPEPLDRRARHVITENARVRTAVAALREGNLDRLGKLLDLSHASLRDDYEVSVPEIDLLVELARRERGVYGARITGGGFGGSIVAVARAGSAREVGERLTSAYREKTGKPGQLLIPAGPS